jgi:hypothetical protein
LLRNVFKEVEIWFKSGFWWLIKGMMKILEVSRVVRNPFQCVRVGLICMWVFLAYISLESTLIIGNFEK